MHVLKKHSDMCVLYKNSNTHTLIGRAGVYFRKIAHCRRAGDAIGIYTFDSTYVYNNESRCAAFIEINDPDIRNKIMYRIKQFVVSQSVYEHTSLKPYRRLPITIQTRDISVFIDDAHKYANVLINENIEACCCNCCDTIKHKTVTKKRKWRS